jgi:hypothetical protein
MLRRCAREKGKLEGHALPTKERPLRNTVSRDTLVFGPSTPSDFVDYHMSPKRRK